MNISGDPRECRVTVSFAVLRAISCPAAVICTSTLRKFARVCHQDAVKFKREHKRFSQVQCLS